jgi:hypothetical protein
MTPEQRNALKGAVDTLNFTIRGILEAGGDSVRVHPFVRYNDDSGLAEIVVEVTTGREVFRSEY